MNELVLNGSAGEVVVRTWAPDGPAQRIVLLLHGYGEHSGRYEHVAARLVADGAVVYAPDHRGHGRSAGERVLISDLDAAVGDVDLVALAAASAHPGLPTVVVGHSMGGVMATRYAQLYPGFAGLALSGPVIGGNPAIAMLLQLDPMPEVLIDPAVLSRDPAVGEAYLADELVWHGPFKRETLLALFAGIDAIAAGPVLRLPVLWMHGEDDALAPLEATKTAVDRVLGHDVLSRVYRGARHEVFNETNREEVLSDLAAFVLARTRS
ncbi:MAG: lysophospholipase [Sporichthyaceae bacterium]